MAEKFDLNDWMGRWDVAIPAAGYAELVSRIRALESASQPGGGEAEYVLRLLVAAGHVTQAKVDEAFDIARAAPSAGNGGAMGGRE